MVWKAEELPSRLRVASLVGKRTDKEANELISKVKERSDGSIPLFVSDNLDNYPHALLNVYGEREEPKREKRVGRPRTRPIVRPPDDLQYGQVVKHRDEHGRITSIERRVVFGTEEGFKAKLAEAGGCYSTISTAHVERDNLTSRQTSARLVRDALSFSKTMEALRWQTALDDLAYNFTRYHRSLRVKLEQPEPTRGNGTPKKWIQRTPAMAAGMTDHRWTIGELMAYPMVE